MDISECSSFFPISVFYFFLSFFHFFLYTRQSTTHHIDLQWTERRIAYASMLFLCTHTCTSRTFTWNASYTYNVGVAHNSKCCSVVAVTADCYVHTQRLWRKPNNAPEYPIAYIQPCVVCIFIEWIDTPYTRSQLLCVFVESNTRFHTSAWKSTVKQTVWTTKQRKHTK